VIAELRAREQCALHVISEQRVNNAQMATQKKFVIDLFKVITDKNECTAKVVPEACRSVPELGIPEDEPMDVRIRKLTAGVHEARTELEKVQFELNLKIVELELKAQPSTLPEVREQRDTTVKDIVVVVDSAVKDCTALFEQSLEVVTILQEDPNVQMLET